MRAIYLIGSVVILLLVLMFMIDIPVEPPGNTRVILEKTYKTYITPPCYEQALKTNNLSENTFEKAKQLGYKPESICSENSLLPINQSIASFIGEKLGLSESKWDW